MPVMQQAGIFQMDPDLGTPDRARAIVQPGTETGVVLSRISETTPPMPLEPSSVTGVYNHTIFAVVKNHEITEKVIALVKDTLSGAAEEHPGIIFTLPVQTFVNLSEA